MPGIADAPLAHRPEDVSPWRDRGRIWSDRIAHRHRDDRIVHGSRQHHDGHVEQRQFESGERIAVIRFAASTFSKPDRLNSEQSWSGCRASGVTKALDNLRRPDMTKIRQFFADKKGATAVE